MVHLVEWLHPELTVCLCVHACAHAHTNIHTPQTSSMKEKVREVSSVHFFLHKKPIYSCCPNSLMAGLTVLFKGSFILYYITNIVGPRGTLSMQHPKS